jgi:Chaperone of endosialidase
MELVTIADRSRRPRLGVRCALAAVALSALPMLSGCQTVREHHPNGDLGDTERTYLFGFPVAADSEIYPQDKPYTQAEKARIEALQEKVARDAPAEDHDRGDNNGGQQQGGQSSSSSSDIRLKRDIVEVGRLANGLHLYHFRYNWADREYVGVMAQEVEKVAPEAVSRGADGYLRVDYGQLGLRLETWDEWLREHARRASRAN